MLVRVGDSFFLNISESLPHVLRVTVARHWVNPTSIELFLDGHQWAVHVRLTLFIHCFVPVNVRIWQALRESSLLSKVAALTITRMLNFACSALTPIGAVCLRLRSLNFLPYWGLLCVSRTTNLVL